MGRATAHLPVTAGLTASLGKNGLKLIRRDVGEEPPMHLHQGIRDHVQISLHAFGIIEEAYQGSLLVQIEGLVPRLAEHLRGNERHFCAGSYQRKRKTTRGAPCRIMFQIRDRQFSDLVFHSERPEQPVPAPDFRAKDAVHEMNAVEPVFCAQRPENLPVQQKLGMLRKICEAVSHPPLGICHGVPFTAAGIPSQTERLAELLSVKKPREAVHVIFPGLKKPGIIQGTDHVLLHPYPHIPSTIQTASVSSTALLYRDRIAAVKAIVRLRLVS